MVTIGIAKLLWKWCDRLVQSFNLEMCIINQDHRASVVARVTIDGAPTLSWGARSESLRHFPYQLSTTGCGACYAPRRQMGTAQIVSTLRSLNANCKWQSWHKLVFGTRKIMSLTGKKHGLVEETKRYTADVVCISSNEHRSSNTVERTFGENYSSPAFIKQTSPKLGWRYLLALSR